MFVKYCNKLGNIQNLLKSTFVTSSKVIRSLTVYKCAAAIWRPVGRLTNYGNIVLEVLHLLEYLFLKSNGFHASTCKVQDLLRLTEQLGKLTDVCLNAICRFRLFGNRTATNTTKLHKQGVLVTSISFCNWPLDLFEGLISQKKYPMEKSVESSFQSGFVAINKFHLSGQSKQREEKNGISLNRELEDATLRKSIWVSFSTTELDWATSSFGRQTVLENPGLVKL